MFPKLIVVVVLTAVLASMNVASGGTLVLSGGVAGGDPGFLGEALVGVGEAQRGGGGQRMGQAAAGLRRAHGAEGGGVHAVALLEEAGERADAGEVAAGGARRDALAPAAGEEGAQIARAQCREIGEGGRVAQMRDEEA